VTGATTNLGAEYEALRHGVGAHQLDRDVLSVSGADAASYLQGQCSQDVEGMPIGGSADALLLSPQGKIDALVRVTRRAADVFIIDTDAGYGEVVDARLKRFRLRVEVEIEPLPWSCVAIRGPEADGWAVTLPADGADPGTGAGMGPDGVLRLPVEWPGLSGFDLVGPLPAPGGPIDDWVDPGVLRCGDAAWEAVRIEAGVPVNGREITDSTIAAEVGLVERTVSFTKGCFTGQELVARLDARGSKVARKMSGLVLGAGAPGGVEGSAGHELPPTGAAVLTVDGEFEVGHLTSVAWSPGLRAAVGLALLHRRIAPPAQVVVCWTADGDPRQAAAEARPLPLVE
jgi:folate-binding protein YgfZ